MNSPNGSSEAHVNNSSRRGWRSWVLIGFFAVFVIAFAVHSAKKWNDTQLAIARDEAYQVSTESRDEEWPPVSVTYTNAEDTHVFSDYEIPAWIDEYLPASFAQAFKEEIVRSVHVASDAELEQVVELFDLSYLQFANLRSKEVTSKSVALLVDHAPELQWLTLEGTTGSAEELKTITRFSNIKELFLIEVNVTDELLVSAVKDRQLVVLSLIGTDVTPQGLKACIKEMENSEFTNLAYDHEQLDDETIDMLSQLPQLEYLWLEGKNLTDASIDSLSNMPNLTFLMVNDPQFTASGIARLRKALPLCDVIIETSPEESPPQDD